MTDESVPAGTLAAMVLAGGRSARMGQDKASLMVGSEGLLARTVRVLGQVAHPVLIVAGPGQRVTVAEQGVVIVRDERPYEGPLVALVRGLEELGGRAPRVFVCGTDHPRLAGSVVTRLAHLAQERGAALALIGERRQLLCGVYASSALEAARRLVAAGERSVRALAAAIDVRDVTPAELLADPAVKEEDPALQTFLDVDTPDDLERLLSGE